MPYTDINKRRTQDRKYQKKARFKTRVTIIGIKRLFGCFKCSEMHPAALQFHHRNPKEKSFSIQKAVAGRMNFDLIIKEIEKCTVLCANCHAKEHYDSGINGI